MTEDEPASFQSPRQLVYSGPFGINVDTAVEQEIGACMVNLVADFVLEHSSRPDAVVLSALYQILADRAAKAIDGVQVTNEADAVRTALKTVRQALDLDDAGRTSIWNSITRR